jgi:Protein of unknown function (DUF4240)
MSSPGITDERFWSILTEARNGASASASPKALAGVLNRLSDAEVSGFGHMFYEKLCALNFWRLWAAGYVIAGGMGDDSFHYFRSWIIGKGKELFEVALKDPDEMGRWIDDRDVDNELLEYVAVEIMKQRQGSDPRELSDCNPDAAPRGEPFDEDTVAEICPKLASLFE